MSKLPTLRAEKGEDPNATGGREREEYEEPLLVAHEPLKDVTGTPAKAVFYGEKDFSITETC